MHPKFNFFHTQGIHLYTGTMWDAMPASFDVPAGLTQLPSKVANICICTPRHDEVSHDSDVT